MYCSMYLYVRLKPGRTFKLEIGTVIKIWGRSLRCRKKSGDIDVIEDFARAFHPLEITKS